MHRIVYVKDAERRGTEQKRKLWMGEFINMGDSPVK